jgi:uroporphyrinogen decarboxylase
VRNLGSTSNTPDFSRLRKVLLRQGEPDRVPLYELFADPPIMAAIMGHAIRDESDLVAYQIRMGYDYVQSRVLGCEHPTTGFMSAEDTAALSQSPRSFRVAGMGCIKGWEDYENYRWPNPRDFDYSAIERTAKACPEGMRVVVHGGHVLEDAMGLMGYERLALALYDDPDLVTAVFAAVGSSYEKAYASCAPMNSVGALVISDDLGFKTATMFSPDVLRTHVFPWYKRYCDIAHAHDKPVILHSCGNLKEIMEDLIVCGIDAKHSYEDQVQPVTCFKKAYGDRMAALGGIDLDFLCRASEDEVRQRVREVLAVCMPGGGYALGTGNTVANYVPVRNFLAMVDEGLKIGCYSR